MSGASITQRLPLVELKGPVFESDTQWQPGRSLQEAGTAAAADRIINQQGAIRTRDHRLLSESQPQQQMPTSTSTPRQHQYHHQLHREASQITMATIAMERYRRRRDQNAASASMELDGRHLSAVGQRRVHQQQSISLPSTATTNQQAASPPPPTTSLTITAPRAAQAAVASSGAAGPSSLPFVRRHLSRHRTLLELTLGQDRLVVDAFAEAPNPGERLAARMRACAGEPTRGQASIMQRQQLADKQQQQQQQQPSRRRRMTKREKTAQTISRAILTYDRSL